MDRMGSTHLDAPALMMHIMERRVLLIQPLQWIPGDSIPAMVVDAFHDRDGAETHGLPDRDAGERQRERCADGVDDEGLREGVVEGAEGVGDVQLMVVRVHISCSDGCESLSFL